MAKTKEKKLSGEEYVEDTLLMNTFFFFFVVMFVLVFVAMLVMSFTFDKSVTERAAEVDRAIGQVYILPINIVTNLVLLLFSYLFLFTCEEFDQEGFSSLAAVFVSVGGTLAMMLLSFILVRGLRLFPHVSEIPSWTLMVVFFVDVFIFISVNPRVSGIFVLDVLLSALALAVVSVVLTIGLFSLQAIDFNYPWSWLLTILGFAATIKRFFLWKYQD
jgi:hypothetical protein